MSRFLNLLRIALLYRYRYCFKFEVRGIQTTLRSNKVTLSTFLNVPRNLKSRVCVWVTQSHPTLWDAMYSSPPVSSIRGILQARILEWVSIPFSWGSSWPRDLSDPRIEQVSCTEGRFLTIWTTREAHTRYFSLFLYLIVSVTSILFHPPEVCFTSSFKS